MKASTSRLSNMFEAGAPTIAVMSMDHAAVGRHSHDFYELVYIREGFCLHEMNDKMTLLIEGDLFMIKPGQFHRYSGNRVVSIFNCLFAEEQLSDELAGLSVFAPDLSVYPHIHLELGERKNVVRLLCGMYDEMKQRQLCWEIKLRGMLDCLLVDYARMYEQRVGHGGQNHVYTGYVMPAIEYIDRHYSEGLSLGDIARSVGVSGDYLTRQFKQAIGIAPLDYMRRYRFARAMELLQQNGSVSDVSSRVGFGSLAHFSREFKKELGITPSQYRNQS